MEIVEYCENWKDAFEKEKILLQHYIPESVLIEHVGSTAIEKQAAKPIIDIFVACTRLESRDSYQKKMGTIYVFIETGMKNRYLFNKKSNSLEYNVHILPFDNDFMNRNEILFRDYLRRHSDLVDEYGKIKRDLMAKFGLALEYTKGKTEFIQKVVDLARREKGLQLINVWE